MNQRPSGYEPDELPLLHPATERSLAPTCGGGRLCTLPNNGFGAGRKAL